MRNLRRTRKRGGLEYIEKIYICGKGVDTERCASDFAAANGFNIVETKDDGNCFYDTLSKFGERTGNPRLNKTHLELRREVVSSMQTPARKAELAPFFVPDVEVAPESGVMAVNIDKELEKFKKSRQWYGWMGDVIPQIAAEVLGVNIVIFDVLQRAPSNWIDRLYFAAPAGVVGAPTVYMLRTNGSHFRLLWAAPVAAAAPAPAPVRVLRKRPKVAPVPNAVNVLTTSFTAINMGNKKNNKKNNKYNNKTKRINNRRTNNKTNIRRKTQKKSKNTQEAENLQRAIEASLGNKELSNNYFNRLASNAGF